MKVISKVKSRLNGAIYDVTLNRYFEKPSFALVDIGAELELAGLQLAGTVSWNDSQDCYRELLDLETTDGQHVDNSCLNLTWQRMASGRFEVTAYVS